MPSLELNLGPQYRALALLAKGGMGAVYLGEMRGGARERTTVAIKVMHQHIAESSETVAMFIDEARVGTRIVHPNVVRVLATDVVQETPFLVMEYVEGLSWSRLLRRVAIDGTPVPLSIAARVLYDALLGLHAAHELDIVHRDVSPQNILVGTDGVVRITDFGLATFDGRITATAPGELRGKLGYIAPEQMHKGGADRRTDVFAAGIVLWEAITSKRLFGADTQAETLAKVLSEPISPPSAERHEVTLDLDDVCLRALERDKARRYQTAAEFAKALEGAQPLATDAELVTYLERLAGEEIAKQRSVRASAERNAERWSAPEIALAPARATAPPASRARLYALAGGAVVLVVAGTLIGRMSTRPVASTERAAIPEPVETAPTAPPSATIVGSSPDPIEVSSAPPTAASPPIVRRSHKVHKAAPSASIKGRYVPGEL